MPAQILYLFPDTNLFVQCRPLDELDWSAWASFDEIHLIVSRPVQREIDNQKNRGNDRVGKRARRAHSVFREIIIGEQSCKLVREADPQVKLLIEPSYRPNPKLSDSLDFGDRDDELIGCLHAYREKHPEADARLLTHDAGPMATAKMLSLSFIAIPDGWLVPPESSELERDRRRLETELVRLKKAEPMLRIICTDDSDNEIDSLEFEHIYFDPLLDEEVAKFVDELQSKFPITTDFGSNEPAERELSSPSPIPGMKAVYTPTSDEKISEYRDRQYPSWLEQCGSILRDLHTALEQEVGQPPFCFGVVNDGSRPGNDVLVTFTAKGSFQIRPPDRKDDDDQDGDERVTTNSPTLHMPPKPPQGSWTSAFGGHRSNLVGGLDAIKALARQLNLSAGLGSVDPMAVRLSAMGSSKFQHDPNSIYYKPKRPIVPVKAFSLECDQWRHGVESELFKGEIHFDRREKEIRGALQCEIHAENLSDPVSKTLPVRIAVRHSNVHDRAVEMVADLIRRGG